MKTALLFTVLLVLFLITPVLSQTGTFMDYVNSTNGDTLFIKSLEDGETNALYLVMHGDSVATTHIYGLTAGNTYPLMNNPTTYAGRTTKIIGTDPAPVHTNKSASSPPVICGGVVGSTSNQPGIGAGGDLFVQNCAIDLGSPDGKSSWAFTGTGAAGVHVWYDNCIWQHTLWILVAAFNAHANFHLSNCYIVNLNGQSCRRNGGVYDGFANLDTFLVENTTHVISQGSVYKWRNYPALRIIVNHNTFVDMAGYQFMDLGWQSNYSFTNNLFVNVNVQCYPGIHSIDDGEQDLNWLPMGLVNVYPDSADEANNTPRKFLVDANLIYWQDFVAALPDSLNANSVIGHTNWQSQMILMNSRTDSMFQQIGRFTDATKYGKLVLGKTYTNVLPNFTDPKDLLSTQAWNIKKYAYQKADTGSAAVLADWKLVATGAANYNYPDWPIPVNLAYDNAALLAGGAGSGGATFPLGDLNWFPTQKATWVAQRTAEYAMIQNALDTGVPITAVETQPNAPVEFRLGNYPNPFNPTTTISFTLPHSGIVTLKVFDILGREVATLINGFTPAGSHDVQFSATSLSSGVYFYKLTSNDFTQTRKMMLIK